MLKTLLTAATSNDFLVKMGKQYAGITPLTNDCRSTVVRAIKALGHTNARIMVLGYPDAVDVYHAILVDLNGRVIADAYKTRGKLEGKTYTFKDNAGDTVVFVVKENVPLTVFFDTFVNKTLSSKVSVDLIESYLIDWHNDHLSFPTTDLEFLRTLAPYSGVCFRVTPKSRTKLGVYSSWSKNLEALKEFYPVKGTIYSGQVNGVDLEKLAKQVLASGSTAVEVENICNVREVVAMRAPSQIKILDDTNDY